MLLVQGSVLGLALYCGLGRAVTEPYPRVATPGWELPFEFTFLAVMTSVEYFKFFNKPFTLMVFFCVCLNDILLQVLINYNIRLMMRLSSVFISFSQLGLA